MRTETIWERGLPADIEAERMILGALLVGGDNPGVTSALLPEEFTTTGHSRIYGAILALAGRREVIDRLTVASELMARAEIDSAGGLSYLVELDASGLRLENLDAWVRIVQDKALMRRAILGCSAAVEECLAGVGGSQAIIAKLDNLTKSLIQSSTGTGGLTTAGNEAERIGPTAIFGEGHMSRISTPWIGLNQIIGGFEPGDLIVIGARPSMGKTVLGCQIAKHSADEGKRSGIFSVEMRNVSLIQRFIASQARIPLYKIRGGEMDTEERHSAHMALAEIMDSKTLLLNDGCTTVTSMRATMARALRGGGIDLVFIDYLQLLAGVGGRRGRVEEVTEISRGIKLLAQEFRCVVIVASQLSRESEKEDREPRLSDLRDSGSIEQDSDIVIFPHRLPGQAKEDQSVRTELIVAKNRNGRLGRTPVLFEKPYVRFV